MACGGRARECLHAYRHAGRDSRPAAPVFAGASRDHASRQRLAATSGIGRRHRRSDLSVAVVQGTPGAFLKESWSAPSLGKATGATEPIDRTTKAIELNPPEPIDPDQIQARPAPDILCNCAHDLEPVCTLQGTTPGFLR